MKLDLTYHGPVDDEQIGRNRDYVRSLGLRPLRRKRKRPPLAIVGGGPSLRSNAEKLRRWKGDIWISSGAFPWCRENGIDGVFFNLDPQARAADLARGAKRALVASCNDPSVFEALKDAEVAVFDTAEGLQVGTTVTAAPVQAGRAGYRKMFFFGCDCSYEGQTHAYMNFDYGSVLKVKCDGAIYTTNKQLLGQAITLSEPMRAAPKVFRCRSGGLLQAMVNDPDYDVVGMTYGEAETMKANGRPILEVMQARPYREEDHL